MNMIQSAKEQVLQLTLGALSKAVSEGSPSSDGHLGVRRLAAEDYLPVFLFFTEKQLCKRRIMCYNKV